VLSRSKSAFDVGPAHHASGIDDAVTRVESLGSGHAYVIGGAGIYDLFQPVIDRMVLSRIPGEYVSEHRTDLLEFTKTLVGYDTQNPPGGTIDIVE
jgi:dihydrofolate reductase